MASREDILNYLRFFSACHFSMALNQFHWKHRPTKRIRLAPRTSLNAMRYDRWGDKPAVAMDSIVPSKLQGTTNCADLIPFKAFWATSSAFIPPDDAAITFVISGLLFSSAINLHTRLWIFKKLATTTFTWMYVYAVDSIEANDIATIITIALFSNKSNNQVKC